MTKERGGGRSGDDTGANHGGGERSGSADYGGRDRTAAETASDFGQHRSFSPVDIRQVERMREAIVKADDHRNWRDYLVIAGATLLALCVVATLILASAINARANRIIENDAIRARAGAEVVTRLEGKLDAVNATVEENSRKLDALTTTTTTTTTVKPRTTPTTARPKVVAPASTLPPTIPTTAYRPPPTTTTTTIPPCRFALLSLCLLR